MTIQPLERGAEPALWLARRHLAMDVGEVIDVRPFGLPMTPADDPARGAEPGAEVDWHDLVVGAGFAEEAPGRLTKLHSLPDLVRPGLQLLVIGLNPSPASADSGVGFARPGNRFWPAAMGAGLVEIDRDPWHAVEQHGIGFTDIVKRTTRKAAELDRAEFIDGMARLDRLVDRLAPQACVMIGLMGWRAAVDRKAKAGWQDMTLGRRPVYVMPSTSGLNASASLDDLTQHLQALSSRRHHRPCG